MKPITKLYESLTSQNLSSILSKGSKELDRLSKVMKDIESELKSWGDTKMDYNLNEGNFYLEITVKGKTKSELITKARDLALGYKPLTFNVKNDSEFNLVWDILTRN